MDRRLVVDHLGRCGAPVETMPVAAIHAEDLFLSAAALHSPDVYQGLSARGWSHARCTRFFQQLVASQLLDP